jgi:chaperonin GroES
MPSIEKILESTNVAELLADDQQSEISAKVIHGFDNDLSSRSDWEERNREAMNLALQVTKEKSVPWKNAANIKFPLITIGAIQFSSRTYPAMVNGTDIVKCRSYGLDAMGEKAERAKRVGDHMSYQILEEDEGWEEEFDKLLMSLPIMGCGFKKSYFDPLLGHNLSVNVFPKHLVVDYFARSLEQAKRVTHILEYYKNQIVEKMRSGIYLEHELGEATPHADDAIDERQGTYATDTESTHQILEQHTWCDLDDDGYEEPYIITVHKDSGKLLRIVPRFTVNDVQRYNNRIAKIAATHYFTKYTFIPAPDGGFYDLGFGSLLGPITESINTLINQLIDAGTLANMPSGFIGRGARMKGGEYRFKGGEFKQINATGDDLRKSIFMLPAKEPSQTLFQLLGLLIEYGERISGVTDMMAGQTPGQNTPATTAMAALEQGQMVFSGIHKRVYRALRDEFRKLYKLNRIYLNPDDYYQVIDGQEQQIFQIDYLGDPTDIKPSADPNVSSAQQRVAKAMLVKENAMSGMSAFNGYEVEKRILEAAEVPDIESVMPDPQGPNAIQPPPDPQAEIESAKFQKEAMEKAEELRIKAMLADADIAVKETTAILNLAKAEAAEEGIQMDQYRGQLEEFRERREQLQAIINAKQQEQANAQNQQAGMGGMEGQSGNGGVP